jgi:hypothetical protein
MAFWIKDTGLPRNEALVDRAVGLASVTTVSGGLAINSWAMLDHIIDAARAETIEACAVAAEAQDRVGLEWVRDSLWDVILKRAGSNVRALTKSSTPDRRG